MKNTNVDITIIGAGPVGLMSAYLAEQCGMSTVILDKSSAPLQVGRADALNARTLQLLEIADLFDELHPLGKPCNTSSVWADGKFLSRQSAWWDDLKGCMHKHFLMLGQSFVEQLLDEKLKQLDAGVLRESEVKDLEVSESGCRVTLATGDIINSKYVIGADGSRSMVRNKFDIGFEITRPQIVWAVIDGIIDTDFEKVPEIIVFQAETSDVAWIPREGEIDRFYVRMDTKEFTMDEAIAKINRAMQPHSLSFKEIVWFSQFSVKESVAEHFRVQDRVFLAGDACHIHSVNGGQGLNTGLADAFNLIWKLNMVENHGIDRSLLDTYESERKPVAKSVIEASGELVRSTKYSAAGTHAQDYVKIVEKRSGNVTGMGIEYEGEGLKGQRLHDFEVKNNGEASRIYTHLDYANYTMLVFGKLDRKLNLPSHVKVLEVTGLEGANELNGYCSLYDGQAVLVRPDSYIEGATKIESAASLLQGA